MGKIIQIEVPEDLDVEFLKEEIRRILGRVILIKELKDVDVEKNIANEIAEEIKRSGWERIEKWLKS